MRERTIHLAGGCFWGVEHYLRHLPGVIDSRVGYANGRTAAPTYETVCSQTTDHVETVEVVYDGDRLELGDLLWLFFEAIDPTAVDRQGPDRGRQYRSGVYWSDPDDRATVEAALVELSRRIGRPTAVEGRELVGFWPAEDYHQRYLEHHPDGYCHIPKAAVTALSDRAARVRQLRRLTPEQYAVTQHGATEPAFANPYHDFFQPGVYVDVVSGQPLFLSTDKFDSGCGWPAFARPLDEALVDELPDHQLARSRTEIRTRASGSHLGHVFADGPAGLGGRRYCVNSAALRFVPLAEMAVAGYADLIPRLEAGAPAAPPPAADD
ncbi:MAG: peptide-methionine (R)-S-oxide reductase MsrB [Propionibacteriaceae bacterium]|jgi:peptide methionine sulfoxide reductase msrA/msrB|nr:peptide-methionine (R)-S-oxide reductase MsrB [Propionibacteriaceae bacterium]